MSLSEHSDSTSALPYEHALLDTPVSRRDFVKHTAILAGSAVLATSSLLPQAVAAHKGQALPASHPAVKSHQGPEAGVALLDQTVVETLTPKNFSNLLGGTLTGFSDQTLKNHFKLYENYVAKTNLLNQQIAKAEAEVLSGVNAAYSPYREMQVELSFNHNGAILHELYFGNLASPQSTSPSKEIELSITRSFGTWEAYLKHLIATGKAMRGWVITGFNMRDGHIRNYGLDSHNIGMPTHVYPLLVLDVFEHAYFGDYGTDRAKYLDAFVQNVDWSAVHKRLMFAVHHLMTGPNATR